MRSARGCSGRRIRWRTARQSLDDVLDGRFVREAAAVDDDVGLGVERVANGGQVAKAGERVLVLEQGPMIAPADPLRQYLHFDVEPDRRAAFEHQRPCARV